MINIKEVVPVNNEVSLLGRSYGTTPEGGVDVERGSF